MPSPHFIQLHRSDDTRLAAEAAAGLMQPAAEVSPKFLYDALGSRLFDAITELDEYYPTRTEAGILADADGSLARALRDSFEGGRPAALIDLGAGDSAKAARWFDRLAPQRYLAVDISVDYLRASLAQLQRQHPTIEMVGLGLDFSAALALPDGLVTGPSLVFYPGSSIGNFTPPQALALLQQARALSAGGALLIGVDLVKPAALLEPAYDDALGVTAAFNLNLLKHLNRLLGSDFQLRDWRHMAVFNADESRIEMHLVARRALTVRWAGGHRAFAEGERLHTENSYKWQPDAFAALLRQAGFGDVQIWTDAQGWFAVMLARAA